MSEEESPHGKNWFPIFSISPLEFSSKVIEAHDALHKNLLRRWRKAITGDPERRVCDNMSDERVRTQIQKIDALSFSIGVSLSFLLEWVFFSHPKWFPSLYAILIPFLLLYRFFSYKAAKYQYFMIDFCYLGQCSCLLQILLCKNFNNDDADNGFCWTWCHTNYVLTHGPLASAIVTWNNSLVFHSIDKITSFAIHILPALLYFTIRWDPSNEFENLSWWSGLICPYTLYLVWLAVYIYMETVFLKDDPTLVTSYRYLVADKKIPSTQAMFKTWKRLGFIEGEMSVFSKRTFTVFFGFQSLYILISIFVPLFLIYNSYYLNALYIIFLIIVAIWNGANYYIRVFSRKYNSKFETVISSKHQD